MEQDGVKDLVHHDEIHLAVGEGVEKIGIPIEPFPVSGGGGEGFIQGEGHVHEEEAEEAVALQKPHAGQKQAPRRRLCDIR